MTGRSSLRAARAIFVIAILALGGLAVGGAAWLTGLSSYQQELRSRVETPAGAPKPGRDPAVQRQTGLAAAATARVGNGTRGGRPASAVQGGRVIRPAQLGDPKRTGVLSSGCVLGYGATGSQCVPAHGPGGGAMTCGYLIGQFPAGVAVTSRDVLGLDTNGDLLACGPGDRGVP
jgi:hypothetical protein